MRRVQAAAAGINLFHHEFSLCNSYANGLEAAAQVQCASHLILGDNDQMTPPKATRGLAQALKAQIHSVHAGHNMAHEAPDAVLAALRLALA